MKSIWYPGILILQLFDTSSGIRIWQTFKWERLAKAQRNSKSCVEPDYFIHKLLPVYKTVHNPFSHFAQCR